jgi:hypothetical protein
MPSNPMLTNKQLLTILLVLLIHSRNAGAEFARDRDPEQPESMEIDEVAGECEAMEIDAVSECGSMDVDMDMDIMEVD